MNKNKIVIMGAAGRDFHNFNVYFRDNSNYEVVAFTATQIPDIAGRKYPVELSGPLYPKGIPIYLEEDMPELIKKIKKTPSLHRKKGLCSAYWEARLPYPNTRE